ncbi:MAG: GIY-YIG nuclease family protein [Lutibacter sp.]
MKMSKNGIIYKVVNRENGQVYIGATTTSVRQRQLDHIERANRGEKGKFQQAISTYGTEAFIWEQIDTASSIDELASKEKQFILEYNAKENGYNSDVGSGFKKTIYQYNLVNGSLVNSYKCLTDAGYAVNSTKQNISSACLSVNCTYRGFYWSYNFTEPFKPNVDSRKKEVLQFSLEGYLVAKYVSVAEASRQTGLSKTCISRACRGERANSGGFVWRYE